ncbi:response regulator transcription factor [Evansella tamaricis]|uniref:Response regulator n=1 Tax=Evansella tamaricis TaxID=2069301 RepID=A0ABS6JPT4_9BACI|nr:response regulator [Evansella tamaricis]MBU9714323.1 response regulator [Evansella tamaricis]
MYEKTVLIVDDEPRTRLGIKKVLDTWSNGKIELITVSSGAEAIKVFQKSKVNLIITDIRMPEMTGLRMLETLQNLQEIKPVVIIMSAHSEFEYAQEAIRLGVVDYLLKPISKAKLMGAVESALEEEEQRGRAHLMEKAIDEDLVSFIGVERKEESPISDAMRFVDENLQHPLSLGDVAEHVHLNPSYLSALFKEQANMNFSEYVTRSRMQKAKTLLLTTNLTINNISEAVGYQTPKYFMRLFKETVGKTPNQFRKEEKGMNQIG